MPTETIVPLVVRQLPPEEFARLAAFEPFSTSGTPDPTYWRVIVAEDAAGTIVGFTCLFNAVHMEPLWVHPDYRTRPRAFYQLLGDLWRSSRAVLQEAGVNFVFAVVADTHGERGQRFLEHLGFIPAGGSLYAVPVDDVRLPDTSGG